MLHLLPTQVSLLMTASHFSHKVSNFERNLRKNLCPCWTSKVEFTLIKRSIIFTVLPLLSLGNNSL